MAERHITMARHGQYHRDSHQLGGGDLTPIGVEQATHLARALRDGYPMTALYSSTLRRAVSTAHIVATTGPTLTFQQDENLCEAMFTAPPKNTGFDGIKQEIITAQRIRVAFAYKTYMIPAMAYADEHDVIIAHGNLIRYFTLRAIGLDIDLWSTIPLYHTGINRFIVHPDGSVEFVTHNEVAHLPRRLWTIS